MKNSKKKVLAGLLSLLVLFTTIQFNTMEVNAYGGGGVTVYYKITYRVTTKGGHKKKNKRVRLDTKKATVYLNDYEVIELENAKAKKIKWSVSNKKVLKIEKKGTCCYLIPKNVGSTKVKAKYKGKTYTCKVTIKDRNRNALEASAYPYTDSDGKVEIRYTPSRIRIWNYCRLAPMVLYATVDDPNLLECKWNGWDNNDEYYMIPFNDLELTPKTEYGETWVTITNSFNSQTFRYKVGWYNWYNY